MNLKLTGNGIAHKIYHLTDMEKALGIGNLEEFMFPANSSLKTFI